MAISEWQCNGDLYIDTAARTLGQRAQECHMVKWFSEADANECAACMLVGILDDIDAIHWMDPYL
jgi:hypothetical protein